eukprot:5574647-Amphidinium_carterae.1
MQRRTKEHAVALAATMLSPFVKSKNKRSLQRHTFSTCNVRRPFMTPLVACCLVQQLSCVLSHHLWH